MRKIRLAIAAILVSAALLATGLFAAAININMYKGFVASKIESMTGSHVEIGRLSAGWRGGLLIGIEGLEMRMGIPETASYVIVRNIEIRIHGISVFGPVRFIADIFVTDGRFFASWLKVPVEGISLSAFLNGDSVTISSFSAGLAGGSLTGSGKCDGIFTSPRTTVRAVIEVHGIKSFISSAFGCKQNMDGNARLTFDGAMTGLSWPEISKTLSGGGEFYLDRGIMTNTNLLNQTLGSLTLFPGLSDMVREHVPAPIQEAFRNNDTVIQPLRQVYTIENSYIIMPDMDIRTDTFDVRGEAKSSLTGDVSGAGVITFAQSVSKAIITAVPDMGYVTDKHGMVEFPMAFKAGEDSFKVIPDIKYVGKRIAVQKAGDMVTDLFQKAAGNGADQGSAKPPKLKELINNYMDMNR